jgi:sigma-B regulation protein RsbU (phosphoserine phosphatase)
MEQQDGKYFTIWYGVLNTSTRELRYASGGHPPAIVVSTRGEFRRLDLPGVMIGAFPFVQYQDASIIIESGSKLFVYSDGCYEVFHPTNGMMTLDQFGGILATSGANKGLDQIVNEVQEWQERSEFEDDFSLIQLQL